VFNHLTPAEVVNALGRAARDAARTDGVSSAYARGQLLSAYSSARHVTVEMDAYPAELRAFAADVAAAVEPHAPDLAAGLGEEGGAAQVAALTCAALERLRTDGDDAAVRRIQERLRRLADREVELLAEAIEGPRA
jgi:hypothetical protein